ncbi:MAG: transcription antitermination factor NusB [Anaerovibrio sp.]|uniref:transcription antitermination factor NusB n=1 Tax=uncultured Anaerovibrio sp. TaxID=361586 RepID=UPI001B6321E6|nr:transcription antitermination factor NusB [uncultured Anaerovibrio sp.]MBP3230683.1 transcription antitermination factor NusB [Anaerovibrio sp.]
MSRRQAREIALQTLFQLDMNPIDDGADVSKARQAAIEVAVSAADEAVKLSSNDKKFLLELVNGTECNLEEIDEIISDKSKEWKLNRMMGVDRSITRMAVYELKFREEKLTPNIIINEAVELAKKFGTDESSRFVNGILGAIARG